MFAPSRLTGLIQTTTVNVVKPTVVDASQSSILQASVTQIRTPVGTMEPQQSRKSIVITKQDKIFPQ
jgi:hypothetical protein